MSTFVELSEKMAAVKAEMQAMAQEKGGEVVREFLKPLFDLGVTQASWTQYTPYFNDGEPCEFRVGDMYVAFTDVDSDGYLDDKDGWYYGYDLKNAFAPYHPPSHTSWRTYTQSELDEMRQDHYNRLDAFVTAGFTAESVEALLEAKNTAQKLMSANEELMKMIFGDHVRVTVKTDEIVVEEYDHD